MTAMKLWIAIAIVVAGQAATTTSDKTTLTGVYAEAQAKRGEALYAEKCSSCHGPDLAGLDVAPALAGADFNTDWSDLSLNDLAERIRVSMPADSPGSLSRQQVADLVAFLLKRGNFPAGEAELPAEAETLKGIKFLAKKP